MHFEIASLMLIPLLIFFLKANLKKFMMITFIMSPLTAVAIAQISSMDFSLTLPQVTAILFCVKTIWGLLTKKISLCIKDVDIWIIIFLILSGVSLIYPLLFSKGIVVLTPNNVYEPIKFTIQNITQYLYLVLGICTYISTCITCRNYSIEYDEFIKLCKTIIFILLITIIMQWIIPEQIYNLVFRSAKFSNLQYIDGIIRLSGPTMEASVLSFTMLPFIGLVLNDSLRKSNFLWRIICYISISVLLTTNSISCYIGLLVLITLITVFAIKDFLKSKTIKLKTLIELIIIMIIILLNISMVYNVINNSLQEIIYKILGKGISGEQRNLATTNTINVFKQYPILGVGFGSIRSYDLLSTWLAELGLLGMIVFLKYIYNLLKKGLTNYMFQGTNIFIIILVIIMFISVPEPYYIFIWMPFGIISYLKNEKPKRIKP